jgi:hypothetical protein
MQLPVLSSRRQTTIQQSAIEITREDGDGGVNNRVVMIVAKDMLEETQAHQTLCPNVASRQLASHESVIILF